MEYSFLIKERKSQRSYKEGASHEDLVKILKEAQLAPSWKNMQTSRCYVVEAGEKLEELRRGALPSFNQKSSEHATLIVTTYVKNQVGFSQEEPVNEIGNGWGAYDLGLHDAFLVLSAKNLGYDTLIMGIRDAERIREELHIPPQEEVMSVIALGRGSGTPAMRPRKELGEVVHFY